MSTENTSYQEYLRRVNIVIDYITRHMDKKMSLQELSEKACFSPFHFHRIFKAIVGETLNDFIRRVRLERSAGMLLADKEKAITDIALECGYPNSSSLAKDFKNYFNVSATQWRKENELNFLSEIIPRAKAEIHEKEEADFRNINIVRMEGIQIVYIRSIRGYGKAVFSAYRDLFKWLECNGLSSEDTGRIIGIPYDHPNITAEGKRRYDACIELKRTVQTTEYINVGYIEPGTFASMYFEGHSEDIIKAYNQIYGLWLAKSGYVPANQPLYQIFHSSVSEHLDNFFKITIYIPIEKL